MDRIPLEVWVEGILAPPGLGLPDLLAFRAVSRAFRCAASQASLAHSTRCARIPADPRAMAWFLGEVDAKVATSEMGRLEGFVGARKIHARLHAAPGAHYLTTKEVRGLGGMVSKLHTIEVEGCHVSDQAMLCMAARQPLALSCLRLPWNNTRRATALQAMVAGAGGLEEVDLVGCVGLDPPPDLGRALRRVSLGHCSWVTDPYLAKLSRRHPHLSEVRLEACSVVTDAGVGMLVARLAPLAVLHLGECTQLTQETTDQVAKKAEAMRDLSLRGCFRVPGDALVRLFACTPLLHTLDLSHNPMVSDATLKALGAHCPLLGSVAASCCAQLTDSGVVALAQGARALQHVDLSWCIHLTDRSAHALASLPRLRTADLNHCRSVSGGARLALHDWTSSGVVS
jgi:hypothetical protein